MKDSEVKAIGLENKTLKKMQLVLSPAIFVGLCVSFKLAMT
jgi:hypothetical protein